MDQGLPNSAACLLLSPQVRSVFSFWEEGFPPHSEYCRDPREREDGKREKEKKKEREVRIDRTGDTYTCTCTCRRGGKGPQYLDLTTLTWLGDLECV